MSRIHEFNEMRQKDIFCDAVVRTDDGTEFRVHRVILSSFSDYFLVLFNQEKRKGVSGTPSIRITGISSRIMKLVLDFIYGEKCEISEENMLELIVTADYLGVIGLMRYSEQFIVAAINKDNCVRMMRFGRARGPTGIYKAAKLFILADFVEIVALKRDEIMQLTFEQFHELIIDDLLNVKNEELVWTYCLDWMNQDLTARKPHLIQLMTACRLALLNAQYFNEKVKEHPLVRASDEAKPIITDVIKLKAGLEDITKIDPTRVKLAVPRVPHEVIFAVGGWGQGSPQSRIETYDTRANRWNLIPFDDPAGPRAYHGMISIRHLIYCIGGFNGDEYFSGCRVFDTVTKTWTDISPMHCKRCYVSVVNYNGHIYALGGYDGHNRLNTAEKYDPDSNQWTLVRPMHMQRSDANACVLNNKIYITGGFNGQECLNSVEFYDPDDNNWTVIRNMSIRRSGVSCASYNGKIYVMGGFNGMARLRFCEKYDPDSEEWTPIQEMSFPRSNFAVEIVDDLIFAIGGFNGIQTVSEVECFNPLTDEWNRVASMNIVRSALRACVVRSIPNLNEYVYPNRLELVVNRSREDWFDIDENDIEIINLVD